MHSPQDPCFAEEFMMRILPALIRSGDLDGDAILRLAEECDGDATHATSEDEAERLQHMGLIMRGWVIEAAGPSNSEWRAEQHRNRMKVVKTDPS